ncbi:TPA: fibrinogen-binding protein [Staphylococcus aureus]|nr:fibrinogen-binding protein [Staphylococcus aureus]HEI1231593.1 fibrinogen-binding protein [Staphylococcus aureus]HEI1244960.1 fibrinogen-binding protein [Staphylococcus aureus]
MKNKLIAKSLLTIASIGITTTTLASTADASEGYGPREKKPISINNNIVEYNDGTYKYQSRPKFNTTPKYIKFRHDYNIVEYDDGTFEYGARPQFNKPAAKTEATIKKEQKLIQAQNLVREFEKTHTVSAHRKAQKAVNLVSFEYNVKKMILQERIDQVLKQGLVR